MLPVISLKFYFDNTSQSRPQYLPDAVVSVVKAPSHGTLVTKIDQYGQTTYEYVAADKSWLGNDRFDFEISFNGKKHHVTTRIKMVGNVEFYADDKSCVARVRRIAYEPSVIWAAADSAQSPIGFEP